MRILLDVTRTLVHSRKRTPTGIDRVEHAYIRYLLKQEEADTWFIANTPFGSGALSMSQMRRVLERIEERHRERAESQASSEFNELIQALSRPIETLRSRPLTIHKETLQERDSKIAVAKAFVRGATRFSKLMRDNVPAVYLHTSHLQLDEPNCFTWLKRPQLFPVFFIHDLIPIEFPEFCSAGAAARHVLRVKTALAHARALIVNSAFTRNSLLEHVGADQMPPVSVIPLANTIRELPDMNAFNVIAGAPFFLHVGTIEGRKNIGHLLNVWRHVIATVGATCAPRLIIVGRRGWESENVTSALDRSRELANHVIEVSNINDMELHCLMRNANGLITVSMTEGYGLPPVEAARLGLPVIASDIPAHREILGNACEFVAPHDGETLARKIIALAKRSVDRPKAEASIASFDWDQHVQQAFSFILAEMRSNGR